MIIGLLVLHGIRARRGRPELSLNSWLSPAVCNTARSGSTSCSRMTLCRRGAVGNRPHGMQARSTSRDPSAGAGTYMRMPMMGLACSGFCNAVTMARMRPCRTGAPARAHYDTEHVAEGGQVPMAER